MKKILFALLFLMIAGIMIIEVIKLSAINMNGLNESGSTLALSDIILAESKSITVATVCDVVKSIQLESQISSISPEMIVEMQIPHNKDVVLSVNNNQTVQKGDCLAEYAGKKYLSPVSGRVSSIEHKTKATNIFIVDYDQLIIETRLPQLNSDLIDLDFPIEIRYNNRSFNGRICKIDNQIIDGTIGIQIEYADDQREMRPGSKVTILVIEDQVASVVAIPVEALIKSESGQYYAQVLRSESADSIETIPIQIGLIGNDFVQVLDGIVDGDLICIP